MKKAIGLFVGFAFLLMQAPFIFAFECDNFILFNNEICNGIKELGLGSTEENLILSDLNYEEYFPDHDYIYDRNTNLAINNAPSGVSEYDDGYIDDTWMKIFAVMPSVIYDDNLYVPENIKVLTGFNYNINIPSTYYNSRKRDGRICKRTYRVIKQDVTNKVYVNGIYQGEGDIVSVNIPNDAEIKSKLEIDLEVDVNYYEWDRYCDEREDGECIDWDWDCEYDYDETKRDSITITDTIDVKTYKNNLSAELNRLDSYYSTNRFETNYSNSIELSFENSEFNFHEYAYNLDYSLTPYYVFTLKAEDYNQLDKSNLILEDGQIVISNINDCNIKAFDFFNVIDKSCNLDFQDLDFYIETDKLKYDANETIKVSIYPEDLLVNVSYGNESRLATGEIEFQVQPNKNKISASYNSLTADTVIYLKDEGKFNTVVDLSMFGFINYFFYAVLRKYWGGFI